MLIFPLLGALLIAGGVVQLARAAIYRGRMSDPHRNPEDTGRTLEPRHRGLRFLGVALNWPAMMMIIAGAALLLVPLLLRSTPHP